MAYGKVDLVTYREFSWQPGEQHEIVLLYELLFNTRQGTLVLIDEPELSLHVTWQKMFMPELLSVASEVEFDAIVATHSPYIVGDRLDLAISLDAEMDHDPLGRTQPWSPRLSDDSDTRYKY